MTDSNLPVEPTAHGETAVSPTGAFAVRKGMWSALPGDTSGYGGIQWTLEMPGQSSQPFGEPFDSMFNRALEVVPALQRSRVLFDRGELTIFVDRAELLDVVAKFRDDAHLRFEVCMSVSGVHYPEQTGGELHAVYDLLSYTHNRRVRLEVSCPESDPHIPSIVATYPMADYHEREVWDMFGVIFDGHPALTRILMPDDWQGHPQRKDYPLGGVDVEYKGAWVPSPDNRRSYP